jgi:protein-L-isoaspartate(D-aspartate) O-methyltransferase
MSDQTKRFPLPLSSVVEPSSRATRASSQPAIKVATPQTATQNAARNVALEPATNKSTVASPSKAHVNALARTREKLADVLHEPERTHPLVSDAVRRAMVVRVAKQGVKDATVLAAMEAVPRHLFMEPALASQAYIDASLPIGHHQTISQPYIVARMIEIMRNNRSGNALGRVLEIGTGCGYQAAVLSLVAQQVYSIERIKSLHELAKINLRPLRIANIRLHYGDGMLGLPQAAPFDGIILAAAGMAVPQALLEQMAIGGRLVAPVGGQQQVLQLIERVGKFEWSSTTVEDCHFVPLKAGTT